ncbi:MAG: ArsA family ATPase [Deltaproteobacteria bacterium]|nr:ArsA family ATPase [Deltaproteobacteria bacterium]
MEPAALIGGPGRFAFFSGKGGVGKTTLAAASAVYLARRGKRVLITSTDPAHSLSDVFEREIGHQGAWLEPGLQAVEIDPALHWAEATASEPLPDTGRRAGRVQRTMMEAVRSMGEAPGVDEYVSLELMLDLMSSDEYDMVVFDTAPTGHTLRLLMLPGMLDGWIGRLLSLRDHFARIGRALRKLLPRGEADEAGMEQNLRSARDRVAQARALLTDADRTLFCLVSIPEAMSVLETARTLTFLREHGVPVGLVVANQIQPDSDLCVYCRQRRAVHLRELERLRQLVGQAPFRVVPARARDIRGCDALAGLGEELWCAAGSQTEARALS